MSRRIGEASQQIYLRIASLMRAGRRNREIWEEIGVSRSALDQRISDMRSAGWDLPTESERRGLAMRDRWASPESRAELEDSHHRAEQRPEVKAARRRAGRKGGLARVAKLTPQELSDAASRAGRKGGLARTAKLTPEQRIELARKAGQGNRGKRRQKEQSN